MQSELFNEGIAGKTTMKMQKEEEIMKIEKSAKGSQRPNIFSSCIKCFSLSFLFFPLLSYLIYLHLRRTVLFSPLPYSAFHDLFLLPNINFVLQASYRHKEGYVQWYPLLSFIYVNSNHYSSLVYVCSSCLCFIIILLRFTVTTLLFSSHSSR